MGNLGGRFRQRVTLKQLSETKTASGGFTSVDTTVEVLWAKVMRISAGVKTEEGKEYKEDVVEFTFRYNDFSAVTILDDYALTWNSNVYKITSLDNIGERNEFIKAICKNET